MTNGGSQAIVPLRSLEPRMRTSSASRSPEPRYQATRRSPLGSSIRHEAWLCAESGGKIASVVSGGSSAGAAPAALTSRSEETRIARMARLASGGFAIGPGRGAREGHGLIAEGAAGDRGGMDDD